MAKEVEEVIVTSKSVDLRVYNPTGADDVFLLHAPRLETLAGKTICELSNNTWQYDRIFPVIRESLQKQFPTAKIVPYTEAVSQRLELDNLEHVSKIIKEKGCQAVIVGMAG